MIIGIASDHQGFELKSQLVKSLFIPDLDIEWKDFGCFSKERCDYPNFAKSTCQSLISGQIICGILVCGSGVGMSIAANRFPGVYAALVWNEKVAVMAKEAILGQFDTGCDQVGLQYACVQDRQFLHSLGRLPKFDRGTQNVSNLLEMLPESVNGIPLREKLTLHIDRDRIDMLPQFEGGSHFLGGEVYRISQKFFSIGVRERLLRWQVIG